MLDASFNFMFVMEFRNGVSASTQKNNVKEAFVRKRIDGIDRLIKAKGIEESYFAIHSNYVSCAKKVRKRDGKGKGGPAKICSINNALRTIGFISFKRGDSYQQTVANIPARYHPVIKPFFEIARDESLLKAYTASSKAHEHCFKEVKKIQKLPR